MGPEVDAVEGRRDLYAEAVSAVGRLARLGEEIGAVHVVAGRRPTYPELCAARLAAERYGLTVRLSANGGVTSRQRDPAQVAAVDTTTLVLPVHPSWDQRIAAGARRLVEDVRAWDAGFAGVREGTR